MPAVVPSSLVAPFTTQIRDAARWQAWVEELGGAPVHLVWTRIDPEALRARLLARGRGKDGAKLAGFDAFVARMRPSTPPPIQHIAVDTSDGAPPAEVQLAPHVAVDTSDGAPPLHVQLRDRNRPDQTEDDDSVAS